MSRDEQSVGGALFQTSCQIGSALGTALSSLTLSEVYKARNDLLEGLRATYWFSSAVAFMGKSRCSHENAVVQPGRETSLTPQ